MRVGIDIGGTFTDLVAVSADGIEVVKVPSTPDDPARGFADALGRVGEAEEVRHGTTVATNAVLTRTGARLAFLATEGFRHLLHLARQDRPALYDLGASRPDPLVGRERCVGVPERTGPDGGIRRPLDEGLLRERLRGLGDVEGVAVALLHAYANPGHERAVRRVCEEVLPGVPVSLSSEVLPEFREYERASTTALNAYVQPVLSRYLGRIREEASGAGVGVMWSGGGVRGIERTIDRPVQTLFSGPAAGVIATAWVAERIGVHDVVTLDMGGTSADVAIVDGGRPLLAEEATLDGLPFRTPCLDLVSVGAGGGSIGWVDAGGALRVGPRSAGADPGPACYGRGGTEATVTDAHVVVGHLGGRGLAGGELTLDPDAAGEALARLGKSCGLSPEETAEGMLRVARATMGRAVRSISIERGKDVRRYALVAFGGAGPLHAVPLARQLGIGTVIVPPAPGALAAFGLLVSPQRADASVSRPMEVSGRRDGELRSLLHDLTEEVLAELRDEGIGFEESSVALAVDMRYAGQSHELRIPVGPRPGFEELVRAFAEVHRERYGFAREDLPVEAVTFRATATGPVREVEVAPPRGEAVPEPVETRQLGGAEVPVLWRPDAPVGMRVEGPALVAELDSTTWVPEGTEAEVHPTGALLVEV